MSGESWGNRDRMVSGESEGIGERIMSGENEEGMRR